MLIRYSFHYPIFDFQNTSELQSGLLTKDIQVSLYPIWYQEVGLKWKVPDGWPSAYFNVYRSDAEYGPFIRINDGPIHSNYWTDLESRSFSKFRQDFYKVEAVFTDGRVFSTSPKTWHNVRTPWAEIRANDIQRREDLLLRKFVGIDSMIFKRRQYGDHCPACWSETIERTISSHCPICMGTGYASGYHIGQKIKIQYDPTPNDIRADYMGKSEQNVITGWTTSFPEGDAWDLVLRIPDSKIYRVDVVQVTELQNNPVRQIFQLVELAKGSIEYKLISEQDPALPSEFVIESIDTSDFKSGYEI